MKAHPEHSWRGINPPPVFSLDEFQGGGNAAGAVAGGDHNIASGAGREEIGVAVTVLESSKVQGGNLTVRRFDLNRQPAKEEESSSSSSGKHLDLIRLP